MNPFNDLPESFDNRRRCESNSNFDATEVDATEVDATEVDATEVVAEDKVTLADNWAGIRKTQEKNHNKTKEKYVPTSPSLFPEWLSSWMVQSQTSANPSVAEEWPFSNSFSFHSSRSLNYGSFCSGENERDKIVCKSGSADDKSSTQGKRRQSDYKIIGFHEMEQISTSPLDLTDAAGSPPRFATKSSNFVNIQTDSIHLNMSRKFGNDRSNEKTSLLSKQQNSHFNAERTPCVIASRNSISDLAMRASNDNKLKKSIKSKNITRIYIPSPDLNNATNVHVYDCENVAVDTDAWASDTTPNSVKTARLSPRIDRARQTGKSTLCSLQERNEIADGIEGGEKVSRADGTKIKKRCKESTQFMSPINSFFDEKDDDDAESRLSNSIALSGSPEEKRCAEIFNGSERNGVEESSVSQFHQQQNYQSQSKPYHSDKRNHGWKFLHKVYSSPALMTTLTQESKDNVQVEEGTGTTRKLPHPRNVDSIVLKEIGAQGEADDPDEITNLQNSSTVMSPWTKLILLEELGTASSWFVLLLPYATFFLAMVLDGYSQLKNVQSGPLRGNRNCADMVRDSLAAPFDISIKGFFPVPFNCDSFEGNDSTGAMRKQHQFFEESRLMWRNEELQRGQSSPASCSYPFELREGVGLLSHGIMSASSFTHASSSSLTSATSDRSSIIDYHYRYLMSHGTAFTTGVISNVPATSQSLRGFATFDNLSNGAAALVAHGSVLVSVIVFQRPDPAKKSDRERNFASDRNGMKWRKDSVPDENDDGWSPVLIMSPKRLEMVCKWNGDWTEGSITTALSSNFTRLDTWNCTSHHIIDAFFSLPNTGVLMGGDMRVDVLFSHHQPQKSLIDELWFNGESSIMGVQDDYFSPDVYGEFYESRADRILSLANISNPQQFLDELSSKSVYELEHESESYNLAIEVTRITALIATVGFFVYWSWSMGLKGGDPEFGTRSSYDMKTSEGEVLASVRETLLSVFNSWRLSDDGHCLFWWESPWITFPERRYLLLLLLCLLMLQNPLLAYAFFYPSLYGSAKFRCAADSISGISTHGILFLWLCLVHGLRYHTADFARRRTNQHRRIFELRKATKYMSSYDDSGGKRWDRVSLYYKQYGDVDGAGVAPSSALRLKHDPGSDSFVEFMFPKVILLAIGLIATIMAATSRFPKSGSNEEDYPMEATFLNPDRFGRRSKVYLFSSIVHLAVIQLWGIMIVYSSFITGERLRREPFLSTRHVQLAFRVLSSILLLGVGFHVTLLIIGVLNLLGSSDSSSIVSNMATPQILFDTSIRNNGESLDSKAEILFGILRHASTQVPYSGTASNIGPGKILYATACSLVVAYIFLPSSYFYPQKKGKRLDFNRAPQTPGSILSKKDRKLQGKDKRFVVALARNTHTWRVFPLPIRAHGLLSQHTIKETLNLIGSFQLDRKFNEHEFKYGRGAIYKGKYIPIFCVEIACWLLEASWQAYYSPTEYSLNDWAPGRMSLGSIGLKLEGAIVDSETDTHAYVATNISEQVEGEEDSIVVVAFRGTASISNMKTDLHFRQVPLYDKIVSNIPSFKIQPGKPIVIEENAWNMNKSPTKSTKHDFLCPPPHKYASWPKTSMEGCHHSGLEGDEAPTDHASRLLPAVSNGAKAIIRATPMARHALPCVHEGFLENYSKIRQQIIEKILSALKRQVDKAVARCRLEEHASSNSALQPLTLPKIYITGHSLGGSLSQLLALDLSSNCEIVIEQPFRSKINPKAGIHTERRNSSIESDDEDASIETTDEVSEFWLGGHRLKQRHFTRQKILRIRPPIAVYTYGQPRVGNAAFKNVYKQRVPHTFRVVNEGDAFTSMPTVAPCCGGIYKHSGLEVLLDEGCTGNILVGPTVVETLLRFTKVRTSVAAHSMERYRESLESALSQDELNEYYHGHGGKVRHNERWHSLGNSAPLPSWVTNVKRSHDI